MSLTVSIDKLSLKFTAMHFLLLLFLLFFIKQSFDLSTSALQVLDLPEELYHRIAHRNFNEGKGESLFYGPDNHR